MISAYFCDYLAICCDIRYLNMSVVDLMHPDLLSDEILFKILSERKVKVQGLKQLHRKKLLEIFKQFCLPYEQRKPKENNKIKLSPIQEDENLYPYVQLNKKNDFDEINEMYSQNNQNCFGICKSIDANVINIKITSNEEKANMYKRKIPCYLEIENNFEASPKRQKLVTDGYLEHVTWL